MKRMLFNATQAEELRVAIVDGQKLIDLDIESAAKEQRKSNIYKAIITRLEPSLEAAFVDYGGERHGFLPFKEVSRNYFKPGIDAGKATVKEALQVGQEIVVQVEKEERGNKGAALTTYVSLAGRYLVLMPNNPRGGGVSRRIEGEDRQELRDVMDQLDVPGGMSLIARTAGIGRNAEELQWDLNYLLQLWNAIDGAAKSQTGAFLIYQESSLVIRAIRDYFQPDIGEILIDTDDVYEQAQQFMSHVMPGNVARVKRYHDDVPLFSRFQIEHQIESAYSRQVNLPSGGAIVIDHTEALVSVDVNSGRATRGSDIEETALRTNCEAADEIARQLRLRDLGGLIVIDFIDMESSKNQREVENRLRDALRHDRARVQTGKISRFGLMELSRQRLRPALAETSYITCPRCTGTGHIRSTESAALHILRILEEEAMKENTGAIHCQVPVDVGTFLLNEKRVDIAKIEVRHHANLVIVPNRHLETPAHEIERLRHDQLNEEGIQLASYQLAEKAEKAAEENAYQPPSAKNEVKPAKVEAAVRGITPDQPAPIVEARQTAAAIVPAVAAQPSLWARIVGFFSSGPAAPAAPTPTAKEVQRREGGRDGGRGGRDGGRGGRGGRDSSRGGREGKEGRPGRDGNRDAASEGTSRTSGQKGRDGNREARDSKDGKEGRENRPPRNEQGRESKEGREPREAREPREPREQREPRGPRPERGERPPRNAERADSAVVEVVNAVPPAPTFAGENEVAKAEVVATVAAAAPEVTADGETRNGGRRRRGRGRGRREGQTGAEAGANQAGDVSSDEAYNEPNTNSPEPFEADVTTATMPTVEAAPMAVLNVVDEPVAEAAPVEVAQAVVATVTEVVAPVPAVVAEPVASPVEPIEVPMVAPAAPIAPVAQASLFDIAGTLSQVGLELVQTRGDAPRGAIEATVPQLGRKPKASVIIASEPLQMVETRNE